ncbi:MAG: ion transporter [Pseudomonadota bacterium]
MPDSSGTFKIRLRQLLEGEGSVGARAFQLAIQLLIILSVIAFTVETLPNLTPHSRSLLRKFEVFVITVFTIEYLGRLYVAERRLRFITSFDGIIDLIVILPFYLQFAVDLRSLRVLWLFRVFRLFKLVRYANAARRIRDAFHLVRVDLAVFGVGALFVLYLSSVGIYFFERNAQPDVFASVFHSFWWALATLTTVGYGDIYPVTVGGKVFTFFILMLGLGVFAVPTGLITMAIANTRAADIPDQPECLDEDAVVEADSSESNAMPRKNDHTRGS